MPIVNIDVNIKSSKFHLPICFRFGSIKIKVVNFRLILAMRMAVFGPKFDSSTHMGVKRKEIER